MNTVRNSEFEGAEKVVIGHQSLIGTDTGNTVSSFTDTGSVLDAAAYTTVAATINNTGGANGLSWQVLGSIDGVNYVVVNASANVAFGAAGTPYTVSPAPYRYYKVQVKDQVAASHTAFSVSLIAK